MDLAGLFKQLRVNRFNTRSSYAQDMLQLAVAFSLVRFVTPETHAAADKEADSPATPFHTTRAARR